MLPTDLILLFLPFRVFKYNISLFTLPSPKRHHPPALRRWDHQVGASPEKSMRWQPQALISTSSILRSDQLTNPAAPTSFAQWHTKKNNPPTTQNQSDRRDAAASIAEGRRENQTGGEEIWRWEKQCRSVRREPKIWVGQVRVSATCELFDLWCCVYATVFNVCECVYVCVYAACKANLSPLKHPRLHRSRLLDFSIPGKEKQLWLLCELSKCKIC